MMQTPMEEEAILASNNGSSSVSDTAALAGGDAKMSSTLPEIPTVAVSTTAIAATVQT